MSIQDQENELFSRWADRRPNLVKDGVINEAAYLSSAPKVMFLLKEVNDPNGGAWDLREFISAGARAATWDNITRWVIGIRRLDQELSWESLAQIDQSNRVSVLKSICAVNLKKTPGLHTADAQELARIATEDRELIKEQIALYEPDIIICCGTGREIDNLFGKGEWQTTTRGVGYREFGPKRFAVAYAHPEARVGAPLLYYSLVDAIREITRNTAIVQINRQISASKWSCLLDRVRKINATKQDTRWKFVIEANKIVCIRTLTGNPVFEIAFAEVRDEDRVFHAEIKEATAHLEYLAAHAATDSGIRSEVNFLIDGLIDPEC